LTAAVALACILPKGMLKAAGLCDQVPGALKRHFGYRALIAYLSLKQHRSLNNVGNLMLTVAIKRSGWLGDLRSFWWSIRLGAPNTYPYPPPFSLASFPKASLSVHL